MPRSCPHLLDFCHVLSDGEGFEDPQLVTDSNAELVAKRVERDFRLSVIIPLKEDWEPAKNQVFDFPGDFEIVDFGRILVFLLNDFA